MNKNPRAAAALALKAVISDKQSLNTVLEHYGEQLQGPDLGLYKALCFGICRHFFSLSESCEQHLDKPLRKKDNDVFALLLIGCYQLHYLNQADYAAIDSAVSACKALKKPWASKVVNAILRKVQNEGLSTTSNNAKLEHPSWLIGKINKQWQEHATEIFAGNNQQAPFTLRINLQKTTRGDYSKQLTQEGIKHRLGELSDAAIYLEDKPQTVQTMPGFGEGLFSVQDEAAQLCAQLLNAKPQQRVLDACAAPGGKSCHLLEKTAGISLTAIDIEPSRLEKMQQNLQRLQLQANVLCKDVSDSGALKDLGLFDRVLADVPCSATGVIRRHPDIKLLRQGNDIKALVASQQQILSNLWQRVAPGGVLLYATCSILADENHKQISQFLATHNDAKALPINIGSGFASGSGWQLFPTPNSHDGFYYAKLQKTQVTA